MNRSTLVLAGIAYWRSTNVCVSVDKLVGVVIASRVLKRLIGRRAPLARDTSWRVSRVGNAHRNLFLSGCGRS